MNFFSEVNIEIQILILAIFGAIFGSFVSLVTYRVASKESMILARSKCPHCHKTLKLRSLIPIFSWILQGGKCIFCKHPISARYLAIEFSTMTGFLLSFLALGLKFDLNLIIHLAIFVILMIMMVVDLEHYFIPDFTQYILAFLAFILIVNNNNNQINSALTGLKPAILYLGFGFAVWVFFYFSAGIDGLGIDDFKFFAIAGFMLGTNNFILFMFLSGIIGAVFGTLWQKFMKDETFPFAPAICLSAYICLLVGKPVIY